MRIVPASGGYEWRGNKYHPACGMLLKGVSGEANQVGYEEDERVYPNGHKADMRSRASSVIPKAFKLLRRIASIIWSLLDEG